MSEGHLGGHAKVNVGYFPIKSYTFLVVFFLFPFTVVFKHNCILLHPVG